MRPDRVDVRLILSTVGRLCYVMAVVGIAPIVWSAAAREWAPFAAFVLMSGVFATLGALGTAANPPHDRLAWSHGMVVVALAWLVVPGVAAIPFVLSGHFADPLDAMFDAVSGITTTGLTVIQDLDHLASSLNLWRHLLQFVGGVGIVIAALSVFPGGGGGMALYYGEARAERIFPSVASTARFLWRVSLVHMVVGVALLAAVGWLLVGLSIERSLFHGLMVFLSGFATGGFSPQSTSIGYYHSAAFEVVTATLMVAGAMSFGLHFLLWRGRRRRDALLNLETRTILWTLGVTSIVFLSGLAAIGAYDALFGLTRGGLFHILSAHTGTGFVTVASHEVAGWGGLAFGAIATAMALGGMAQSTSGGVKALRVGLTFKALTNQIKQLLLPERAVVSRQYYQGGRRSLTAELAQAAMGISLLYVALYLSGALVGMAHGIPLQDALFESISASATVGLSVGITDAAMPTTLQVAYMVQMWLGRLEFLAVFVLIGFVVAWVRGR